jgi:hypothetical protein
MGVYGAKFNWVVATTTDIGVGHYRQAIDFEDALGYAGLRDNTTFVALPFEQKFLGKAYHKFQNTRALNNKVSEIIDNPHCIPLIDKARRRSHVWQQLLHKINASPTYDRDKPTIFITTHGDQERAAIFLMNAELVKGYAIIAAVPDAWRGGSLASMTAERNPYNALHLVVVHNASTAAQYHVVRPYSTAIVQPLGTASDPYFLIEEQRKHDGPLHIGIEFSGNNIHKYSSLIMKFIKSIQYQLRDGEVRLSVHIMNHMNTINEIRNLLSSLHLCGVSNIRLLSADTLEEAIKTRKHYIRGTLDENWPAPDVVTSKGGEVPLEYRGNQLIVAVWGEGHERDDILVGVKEGRTLDFRSLPPDQWYSWIVSACKLRELYPPQIPQSYAVFAPLLIFDPHALDEFLIS